MDKETLIKFHNEPGLMSIEQILEVQSFLVNLHKEYKIYADAYRLGSISTMEILIEQTKWYVDFKKKNPNHGK